MTIKASILTFHNTPNYGATLQCFALSNYLRSKGAQVEVINYMPIHTIIQYSKSLFLGKRRSLNNFQRIALFYSFVRKNLVMSGPPIFSAEKLQTLRAKKYDIAFTGSDEVWKVDHMRNFDPSYYFSFLDPQKTRLVSYAATSSTVTDLRKYAKEVTPLLQRFSGLGIRDRSTAIMVEDLLGKAPVDVLDPTLIWDFTNHSLPPMRSSPYVAVYSWLDQENMNSVRQFAKANQLEVVCVGCRHPEADANLIGIGPEEWLRLIKNASAVVTDFFHGVLFSIIFERPFFAHVDEKKKMKLRQALSWVDLTNHLHDDVMSLASLKISDIDADWTVVKNKLTPLQEASRSFIDEQLKSISLPIPQ